MMKKLYLFCFLPLFFFVPSERPAEALVKEVYLELPAAAGADRQIAVGEEITYVVRYGFIKLGEIRLKVLSKKDHFGKPVYGTIAYIDSYANIPFVYLHQIYESKVNSEYYSNYFKALDKKKEYTTYTEYGFDYSKKVIGIKKGKVDPPEKWTDSTAVAETMFHDGLTIFYYARMYTGSKRTVRVPCFVKEAKVYTEINFYDKIENINIDAVDYPIPCTYLDGRTDFVSVFGLTGYFEGWFTNDQAAVPTVAKLNVIIGKVTVELVKWKRQDGWNPPKT